MLLSYRKLIKKKQILFGALTLQVTKQSKQKAWQEICTTAASLESSEKSWCVADLFEFDAVYSKHNFFAFRVVIYVQWH
jgi:hypothetical protein